MKSDITRTTFKKKKHYSGVRMQQGRVQVDADWNEQQDIVAHRVETETCDVIGRCGAPMHEAGFALVPKGNNLEITAGRYYVDGILCENERIIAYTTQPDLPETKPVTQAGTYLAYLDVWSRHITAMEDPSIREVALGGPDTATRAKTVWQVKLLQVDANANCLSDLPAWNAVISPPDGKLAARAEPDATSSKPCIVAPGAGYRRLENQLYRVECHIGGPLGTATFKWSRDNGSILTKWESQDVSNPNNLTVSSVGRDKVLNFTSGQWVELTDDTRELMGKPGTLVQLSKVEGLVLTIDLSTASGSTALNDFPRNPKVRRWDMTTLIQPTNTNWKDLEDGVQVKFDSGDYKTGDYWLIPARTATADVEWPKDQSDPPKPIEESPHGIQHHYCRLGFVTFEPPNFKTDSFVDCRCLFPSLTQVTSLYYVSGDGQEAMPDVTQPAALVPLPQPLVVGVANAKCRDHKAKVRFTIIKGNGKVMPHGGTPVIDGKTADILTDDNGLALCDWQLDPTNWSQQVEATLLDANDKPIHLPIRFNANLSISDQVAYESGQCLLEASTVKEALDQLCQNITLYYVCGDGQEAMPGNELPAPIQVRVANGRWPKAGARVKFSIVEGNGSLLYSIDFTTVNDGGALIVTTNNDGLAQCRWQLGNNPPPSGQKVEVTLLDVNPVAKLCFNANLSVASQVAYDPSQCHDLLKAEANTVQKAIDRLCSERDLRHHKKYLHGWGIVCGLQVICGPDGDGKGEHITVRQGYAIDCEGNDIIIEQDETVNVMAMIQEYDRGHRDAPILDDKSDGEVCIKMGLNESSTPRYDIERFEHEKNSIESLLAGTLLMDFYNHCIKNIHEFMKKELAPPESEKDLPAGPVHQRLSALTNLLAQLVNPDAGQHIFISMREHKILHDFYVGLRALLQSETFCAMFETARPFPEYPFKDLDMDTIFSRNLHSRIRLRPRSLEAYTVGEGANPLKPSTTINRFDLRRNMLVAQIDPFADVKSTETKSNTDAVAVQDVAFSTDGKMIYVIASTRGDEDTLFRVGVIDQNTIEWQSLVTFTGVKLVTLATTVADLNNVYAIGLKKITTESGSVEVRGAGLYRINPEDVSPTMEPFVPFNAYGHLKITEDGQAFATAAASGIQSVTYDRVQVITLAKEVTTREITLGAAGQDDIAIVTRADGEKHDTLYSVVGPDNQGIKRVLVHGINADELFPMGEPIVIGEPSAIRMEPVEGMLLLTLEEGYSVRMIDMQQNKLVEGYLLPTQVGPIAISADASSQHVYILNYASNTILSVPTARFQPDFPFPVDTLAAYRKGVLEAFADLLGGFLQYLKDCLCDHFLVNCPDCKGDEVLYLACISIRQGKVYKVCNFSKRRYVKSFPTVGYWLSLIPIIPFLDKIIEKFCCSILPDLFSSYTVSNYDEKTSYNPKARVPVRSLRGIFAAQGSNILEKIGSLFGKGRTSMGVAFDALLHQTTSLRNGADPALASSNIMNQPIERTEALLRERGVEVERVPYDPSNTSHLLTNLAGFLRTPSPGTKVRLYEEKGNVRYYSVSDPAVGKTTPLQSDVNVLRDQEIATLKQTVEELKAQVDLLVQSRSPEKPKKPKG